MSSRKIKIFAPLDRKEEALPLIKAGADEFFCGVIIDGVLLSCRRTWGDITDYNLPNLQSLEELVKIIKRYQKKIFVNLNLLMLGQREIKTLEENIKKIINFGVDGFILANFRLMEKMNNLGTKIIASSFFETKNTETVELLTQKEFGAKRIIFDRQISLRDLESIVSAFPKLEFEAFIFSTKCGCRILSNVCPWGSLTKRHLFIKRNNYTHLCQSFYTVRQEKKMLNSEDEKIVAGRLSTFHESCGACALWQFRQFGISSVKIVGRGFPISVKLKAVRFIKSARDILEENHPQNLFYRKVEKLFEKTFGKKCRRQYCYYPHFF